MVRPHLRIKLRAAIHRAMLEKARIVIPGGRTNYEGKTGSFEIAVQPALIDGEDLLLVCFIDDPAPVHKRSRSHTRRMTVEQRRRARAAIAKRRKRNFKPRSIASKPRTKSKKRSTKRPMSVNEEYQSTNEELLTSKEELQSMNEELTALNSQLQETLERQRTTASDLQNILYSTDVATIFLDIDLNIRFFTPATKSLFNIIPDRHRPAARRPQLAGRRQRPADRRSRGAANALADRTGDPGDGTAYGIVRRILPYRAQNDGVEGRRHYLCRYHRAPTRCGRAGIRQAGSTAGQYRQVPLPRRREP